MSLELKFLLLLALISGIKTHPLDPLNSSEISETSSIIKGFKPQRNFIIIWITLQEPEKRLLFPFFLNGTVPLENIIPRQSFAILIDPANPVGKVIEAVVDLDRKNVTKWTEIGNGELEPSFGYDETEEIEKFILEDESVQQRLWTYGKQCRNLSLVKADVWKYGYKADKPTYKGRRIVQSYFYLRSSPNDNYFVHPLGFIAIVDVLQKKVLEIQELPIHDDFNSTNRIDDKVPIKNWNYDSKFNNEITLRKINPIKFSQDAGPNFKIVGNRVEWQKFEFLVGFNGREGLVLHHITYNDGGKIRPLIYRAALSEVFVPYGDSRDPYYRKMAFDSGEYGLGFTTNSIQSEICKGSVHYISTFVNKINGEPEEIKNAICIYEEDGGILWHKQDEGTKRSVSARSQVLVVSFMVTLSNYDYIFKWKFYQDASIQAEVALTGIVDLNLSLGSDGGFASKHGTQIGNLDAQFHQHFFVYRIDVDFDGKENSVVTVDVVPDEAPSGSPQNPYGNGFTASETVLKTPAQAQTQLSRETSRTWKITSDKMNPLTGSFTGWTLHPGNSPPVMIKKESPLYKKCAFVDSSVWITGYKENQLFAGGFYLNNSGLPEWVENDPDKNLIGEDVVLWHVVGLSHLPRAEDFPVMPAETIGFWLKPYNFFTQNPALDVPPIALLKI